MYQYRGYVLLAVLIFLQIFSCLGLYELMSVASVFRTNYHEWLKELSLNSAKKALAHIEVSVLNDDSNCHIPITSASELAKNPLNWWQLKACSSYLPDFRYYYVVESLGDDPCGIVAKNSYNHIVMASYYRITLFVVMDKIKGAKLILQSTLAKPSLDHLSCLGNPHLVTPGRQAMREL